MKNKDSSLRLERTQSDDPHFTRLVIELDAELAERDGDDHSFYAQFNTLEAIRHALVLTKNGQPIGCGAFKEAGRHAVEVKRMFILPEYRNRGYASLLLDGLERWALQLGYAKCILETGLRQPEAIRLYKRCGYRIIDNFGPYKGVSNSVCFEKTLV